MAVSISDRLDSDGVGYRAYFYNVNGVQSKINSNMDLLRERLPANTDIRINDNMSREDMAKFMQALLMSRYQGNGLGSNTDDLIGIMLGYPPEAVRLYMDRKQQPGDWYKLGEVMDGAMERSGISETARRRVSVFSAFNVNSASINNGVETALAANAGFNTTIFALRGGTVSEENAISRVLRDLAEPPVLEVDRHAVGPETLAKEVTGETIKSRIDKTKDALDGEEGANTRDPIAVIGLSPLIYKSLKDNNANPDAYKATLEKVISRGFGRKGKGAGDNVHKIKLFFAGEDPAETNANLQRALSEIRTDQEVVVFNPQTPEMPSQIDQAVLKPFGTHVTVVPDAYTDSKTKGFPDIGARITITRLIAWYKDPSNNKTGRDRALAVLTGYLGDITGKKIEVADLVELLAFLQKQLLRIGPVNYKDITEWENSYEALATAL
jgi:hypothetical protein